MAQRQTKQHLVNLLRPSNKDTQKYTQPKITSGSGAYIYQFPTTLSRLLPELQLP